MVSNEHNVRQKDLGKTPLSNLFQALILCVQLSHGNNGFGKMDFTKFWENAASLKYSQNTPSQLLCMNLPFLNLLELDRYEYIWLTPPDSRPPAERSVL